MHTDVTVVTIHSYKIISNEIKDSQALLEPSYGKKLTNFFANPILLFFWPLILCDLDFLCHFALES